MAEVLPQMEPVSDLQRVRGALACSLGMRSAIVAVISSTLPPRVM
ncbi:hypothetical protein [Nocardia sp. NPDC004750]